MYVKTMSLFWGPECRFLFIRLQRSRKKSALYKNVFFSPRLTPPILRSLLAVKTFASLWANKSTASRDREPSGASQHVYACMHVTLPCFWFPTEVGQKRDAARAIDLFTLIYVLTAAAASTCCLHVSLKRSETKPTDDVTRARGPPHHQRRNLSL